MTDKSRIQNQPRPKHCNMSQYQQLMVSFAATAPCIKARKVKMAAPAHCSRVPM